MDTTMDGMTQVLNGEYMEGFRPETGKKRKMEKEHQLNTCLAMGCELWIAGRRAAKQNARSCQAAPFPVAGWLKSGLILTTLRL